jgi:hypothetical protein
MTSNRVAEQGIEVQRPQLTPGQIQRRRIECSIEPTYSHTPQFPRLTKRGGFPWFDTEHPAVAQENIDIFQ